MGHTLKREFAVTIDLFDLNSNKCKVLYSDDNHKIYVSNVQKDPSGYTIQFRSVGDYSLTGASLISGQHHIKKEGSFTTEITAKFKGKSYKSSIYNGSGLNYKDGDEFGFCIFPSEAYDSNVVTLNETDTVKLTVSNLYKNIWEKK